MKHTNQFFLLALSLAAVCSGAVAKESGVEGASKEPDTSVGSSTLWATVASTVVTPDATFPSGGTYHCAVTCTATFQNLAVSGNDAEYYLGLGTSTTPASESRQVVSFKENTGEFDEANWGPIATTYLFPNLSGSKTFFCLAKKVSSSDPNGNVGRAAITAACSDHRW